MTFYNSAKYDRYHVGGQWAMENVINVGALLPANPVTAFYWGWSSSPGAMSYADWSTSSRGSTTRALPAASPRDQCGTGGGIRWLRSFLGHGEGRDGRVRLPVRNPGT